MPTSEPMCYGEIYKHQAGTVWSCTECGAVFFGAPPFVRPHRRLTPLNFTPPNNALRPAPAASGEPRPAQKNCQQEPPYPGAKTVVASIRNPDLTCHDASAHCATEAPHPIAECGEFQAESGEPTDEERCLGCNKLLAEHSPLLSDCQGYVAPTPAAFALVEIFRQRITERDATIAALRAEVEAGRRDTARLNWIDENADELFWIRDGRAHLVALESERLSMRGADTRDAIDRVRAALSTPTSGAPTDGT